MVKYMDAKKHIPIGFLACLAVYLITYYYYGNGDTYALFIAGVFGSMCPDLDQLIHRHRDFFFHSVLFPAALLIYMLFWNQNRYYDVFFFTFSYGFHLLCDLKFKGKIGTYLIVKPGWVLRKEKKKETKKGAIKKKDKNGNEEDYELGIKRFTAKQTDVWLIFNFSACFAICFFLYILF
jgi:hypothetical protein